MFFGIKHENFCFFIGYESVEIRSFAPMSATRAHIPEKKEKFFLTLNRLIYNV